MTPQEIDELLAILPEYVNGTLFGADARRMDDALAQSAKLRRALAHERSIQNRIKKGIDEMMDESITSEEARLAALMKKTQADDKNEAEDTYSDVQKSTLTSALSLLNPKRWHPAIALSLALAIPAQAAIIGGQAVTIASLEDENFRLASGPCKEANTNNAIILEFTESANWQDVAQLLDTQKLTITERGSFGALSVRSKNEGDALRVQIEELKTSPLIVSAEAIQ